MPLFFKLFFWDKTMDPSVEKLAAQFFSGAKIESKVSFKGKALKLETEEDGINIHSDWLGVPPPTDPS